MSMPKLEPAPQDEPPYDPNTQRKLPELAKTAGAVRRHQAGIRLARDQRGAQHYVLMAEGVSQAKLANVFMMTRQGVAYVAHKWAKETTGHGRQPYTHASHGRNGEKCLIRTAILTASPTV
jgi:hypothetical protein